MAFQKDLVIKAFPHDKLIAVVIVDEVIMRISFIVRKAKIHILF